MISIFKHRDVDVCDKDNHHLCQFDQSLQKKVQRAMMATMDQGQLHTLDPDISKDHISDDEGTETGSKNANNTQAEAEAVAIDSQGQQKTSSMNKEVFDDELKTPRKSILPSHSLSQDSLVAGTMSSENGSVVSSDGDPNCSGIGIVSMLGGQLLSPILRSSEFGLKHDDNNPHENESTRHVTVLSQMQQPSPEDADNSLDENGAASQYQKADSHDKTNTDDNGTEGHSSAGSIEDDDILLAQKQAGASAQAFIQGLRGAAHRRKMNLTRSRDSLAAKEKERKEEAERMALQKMLNLEIKQHENVENPSSLYEFRARALPKSTRMGGVAGLPKVVKRPVTTPFSPCLGPRRASMPAKIKSIEEIQQQQQQQQSGGVTGLPKVDKRPVTTPFSPMLGARRQSLAAPQTQAKIQDRKHQQIENTVAASFRARPMPKGLMERGGQSGVPKVSKRPTTMPSSPLLGPRRPKNDRRRYSMIVGRQSDSQSTVTAGDSTPIGLDFVSDSENQENRPAHHPTDHNVLLPKFKEFQLQSSIRAKKRAAFDEIRKLRWEARQQEELDLRRERIRRLERELGELRWEL